MNDNFENNQLILTYLVSESVRGNRDAQNQLMLLAEPFVKRLARELMKREHDAEDLTQDVLTKALLRLDQLDSPLAFYGWLRRITFNLGYNKLRKGKRRAQTILEHEDQVISDEIDAAEAFCMTETIEIVRKCLESLPEKNRTLLYQRYFEGLKEKELADLLDVPQGTVKSRLHKANRMLRERIEAALAV